jgi:hypothetical protein
MLKTFTCSRFFHDKGCLKSPPVKGDIKTYSSLNCRDARIIYSLLKGFSLLQHAEHVTHVDWSRHGIDVFLNVGGKVFYTSITFDEIVREQCASL